MHAGETDGSTSIWEAIRIGGSRRVGHGVRAIEDPNLIEYLRDNQVPLEVCLSSNVCLKIFPSLNFHSLPQLMEQGLFITINSDDPPMFNTTLTDEYLLGQKTWNWGCDTIEKLMFNAVDAALLPDNEKLEIRDEFER